MARSEMSYNYQETLKAIFDEARKAGDAREAERNADMSQPEENDNQTTHELGGEATRSY